jgi:hypothetical protein
MTSERTLRLRCMADLPNAVTSAWLLSQVARHPDASPGMVAALKVVARDADNRALPDSLRRQAREAVHDIGQQVFSEVSR